MRRRGHRPLPKGHCGICAHPLRQEIDDGLLRGDSLSTLAERCGYSKSLVHHHARLHVARDDERAATISQEVLIERLEGFERHARRILGKAERAEDYRAAVAAIREMRGSLDSIARITGAIRDRAEVNVQVNIDEAASIRMAMVFLERRGWKLTPPPIEVPALPPAIETEQEPNETDQA